MRFLCSVSAVVAAVAVANEPTHMSTGRLGVTNFDTNRWNGLTASDFDNTEEEVASVATIATAPTEVGEQIKYNEDHKQHQHYHEPIQHMSSDHLGVTNFDLNRWDALMTVDYELVHNTQQDTIEIGITNETATTSEQIEEEQILSEGGCYKAASCPPCHETQSCCMTDNYRIYNGGQNLGCTSNSLDFQAVTGFKVFDEGAYECNCGDCSNGPCPSCDDPSLLVDPADCMGLPYKTVFGACRGIDDNVQVSFTVNINVGSTQYDVGLYVATDGGEGKFRLCFVLHLNMYHKTHSPLTPTFTKALPPGGQCIVAGLLFNDTNGNDFTNVVGDNDGDTCWDFVNSGDLVDYPFQTVTIRCSDAGPIDGLLDFSVAASFAQNAADPCSYDGSLDAEGNF